MLVNPPLLPLLGGRDHAADTRARLETLTRELASGRHADAGRALSSDFSALSQATHDLRTHDARAASLSGAAAWLDVTQGALEAVGVAGDAISETLNAALTPAGMAQVDTLAGLARDGLADMVSALGRTFDGRAVFGNGDPSGAPPIDLEVLSRETRALAAAALDIDALLRAFDDYFSPGGGIEANALRAYPPEPARFPLGDGAAVEVPISAGDPAIRSALGQAALVAALPDAGFALTEDVRAALSTGLPARAAEARNAVTDARARIGGVEARVARHSEALDRERAFLEGRKSSALAADPFETATRLQDEMTRLETIYAVTARRARLRLTDYLR